MQTWFSGFTATAHKLNHLLYFVAANYYKLTKQRNVTCEKHAYIANEQENT